MPAKCPVCASPLVNEACVLASCPGPDDEDNNH